MSYNNPNASRTVCRSALAAIALAGLVGAAGCEITPEPGEICLGTSADFALMDPHLPNSMDYIVEGAQLCVPMGRVAGDGANVERDGVVYGEIFTEPSSKWLNCAERRSIPLQEGEALVTNRDGRHRGGEILSSAITTTYSSKTHCSDVGFNILCNIGHFDSDSFASNLMVYAQSREDCVHGAVTAQCMTDNDCAAVLPAAQKGSTWACEHFDEYPSSGWEDDSDLPWHLVLYVEESVGTCVQSAAVPQ